MGRAQRVELPLVVGWEPRSIRTAAMGCVRSPCHPTVKHSLLRHPFRPQSGQKSESPKKSEQLQELKQEQAQMSELAQQSHWAQPPERTAKADLTEKSELARKPEWAEKSEPMQKPEWAEKSEPVRKPEAAEKSELARKPEFAEKSEPAQKSQLVQVQKSESLRELGWRRGRRSGSRRTEAPALRQQRLLERTLHRGGGAAERNGRGSRARALTLARPL